MGGELEKKGPIANENRKKTAAASGDAEAVLMRYLMLFQGSSTTMPLVSASMASTNSLAV